MKVPFNWRPDNAAEARQFFKSNTGQQILEYLRINRPALGGLTMEASHASSNRAAGWEECVESISELLVYDDFSSSDQFEFVETNPKVKSRGTAQQNG